MSKRCKHIVHKKIAAICWQQVVTGLLTTASITAACHNNLQHTIAKLSPKLQKCISYSNSMHQKWMWNNCISMFPIYFQVSYFQVSYFQVSYRSTFLISKFPISTFLISKFPISKFLTPYFQVSYFHVSYFQVLMYLILCFRVLCMLMDRIFETIVWKFILCRSVYSLPPIAIDNNCSGRHWKRRTTTNLLDNTANWTEYFTDNH